MTTKRQLASRIAELEEINRQITETNAILWLQNSELRSQLDVARRSFGEAFIKGHLEPPKGPDRPNRKKLTKQEVKDIRAAYKGGVKQRDLAENYGVNSSTISRIVRGIYH